MSNLHKIILLKNISYNFRWASNDGNYTFLFWMSQKLWFSMPCALLCCIKDPNSCLPIVCP